MAEMMAGMIDDSLPDQQEQCKDDNSEAEIEHESVEMSQIIWYSDEPASQAAEFSVNKEREQQSETQLCNNEYANQKLVQLDGANDDKFPHDQQRPNVRSQHYYSNHYNDYSHLPQSVGCSGYSQENNCCNYQNMWWPLSSQTYNSQSSSSGGVILPDYNHGNEQYKSSMWQRSDYGYDGNPGVENNFNANSDSFNNLTTVSTMPLFPDQSPLAQAYSPYVNSVSTLTGYNGFSGPTNTNYILERQSNNHAQSGVPTSTTSASVSSLAKSSALPVTNHMHHHSTNSSSSYGFASKLDLHSVTSKASTVEQSQEYTPLMMVKKAGLFQPQHVATKPQQDYREESQASEMCQPNSSHSRNSGLKSYQPSFASHYSKDNANMHNKYFSSKEIVGQGQVVANQKQTTESFFKNDNVNIVKKDSEFQTISIDNIKDILSSSMDKPLKKSTLQAQIPTPSKNKLTSILLVNKTKHRHHPLKRKSIFPKKDFESDSDDEYLPSLSDILFAPKCATRKLRSQNVENDDSCQSLTPSIDQLLPEVVRSNADKSKNVVRKNSIEESQSVADNCDENIFSKLFPFVDKQIKCDNGHSKIVKISGIKLQVSKLIKMDQLSKLGTEKVVLKRLPGNRIDMHEKSKHTITNKAHETGDKTYVDSNKYSNEKVDDFKTQTSANIAFPNEELNAGKIQNSSVMLKGRAVHLKEQETMTSPVRNGEDDPISCKEAANTPSMESTKLEAEDPTEKYRRNLRKSIPLSTKALESLQYDCVEDADFENQYIYSDKKLPDVIKPTSPMKKYWKVTQSKKGLLSLKITQHLSKGSLGHPRRKPSVASTTAKRTSLKCKNEKKTTSLKQEILKLCGDAAYLSLDSRARINPQARELSEANQKSKKPLELLNVSFSSKVGTSNTTKTLPVSKKKPEKQRQAKNTAVSDDETKSNKQTIRTKNSGKARQKSRKHPKSLNNSKAKRVKSNAIGFAEGFREKLSNGSERSTAIGYGNVDSDKLNQCAVVLIEKLDLSKLKISRKMKNMSLDGNNVQFMSSMCAKKQTHSDSAKSVQEKVSSPRNTKDGDSDNNSMVDEFRSNDSLNYFSRPNSPLSDQSKYSSSCSRNFQGRHEIALENGFSTVESLDKVHESKNWLSISSNSSETDYDEYEDKVASEIQPKIDNSHSAENCEDLSKKCDDVDQRAKPPAEKIRLSPGVSHEEDFESLRKSFISVQKDRHHEAVLTEFNKGSECEFPVTISCARVEHENASKAYQYGILGDIEALVGNGGELVLKSEVDDESIGARACSVGKTSYAKSSGHIVPDEMRVHCEESGMITENIEQYETDVSECSNSPDIFYSSDSNFEEDDQIEECTESQSNGEVIILSATDVGSVQGDDIEDIGAKVNSLIDCVVKEREMNEDIRSSTANVGSLHDDNIESVREQLYSLLDLVVRICEEVGEDIRASTTNIGLIHDDKIEGIREKVKPLIDLVKDADMDEDIRSPTLDVGSTHDDEIDGVREKVNSLIDLVVKESEINNNLSYSKQGGVSSGRSKTDFSASDEPQEPHANSNHETIIWDSLVTEEYIESVSFDDRPEAFVFPSNGSDMYEEVIASFDSDMMDVDEEHDESIVLAGNSLLSEPSDFVIDSSADEEQSSETADNIIALSQVNSMDDEIILVEDVSIPESSQSLIIEASENLIEASDNYRSPISSQLQNDDLRITINSASGSMEEETIENEDVPELSQSVILRTSTDNVENCDSDSTQVESSENTINSDKSMPSERRQDSSPFEMESYGIRFGELREDMLDDKLAGDVVEDGTALDSESDQIQPTSDILKNDNSKTHSSDLSKACEVSKQDCEDITDSQNDEQSNFLREYFAQSEMLPLADAGSSEELKNSQEYLNCDDSIHNSSAGFNLSKIQSFYGDKSILLDDDVTVEEIMPSPKDSNFEKILQELMKETAAPRFDMSTRKKENGKIIITPCRCPPDELAVANWANRRKKSSEESLLSTPCFTQKSVDGTKHSANESHSKAVAFIYSEGKAKKKLVQHQKIKFYSPKLLKSSKWDRSPDYNDIHLKPDSVSPLIAESSDSGQNTAMKRSLPDSYDGNKDGFKRSCPSSGMERTSNELAIVSAIENGKTVKPDDGLEPKPSSQSAVRY